MHTVEGVGGRADIRYSDALEGWDPGIHGKSLYIQIRDTHLPTVLETLLRMEGWMTVDIYANALWTLALSDIVQDANGFEVGPERVSARDPMKRRYCVGPFSVRFHVLSENQPRPQSNVNILLEIDEDDFDVLYDLYNSN
jgi:hypothetical protein